MKFEILATGSKGNCVVLNDIIAIDMGIPFKTVKTYLKQLQLVLLTHEHQDHFKTSTIRTLAAERPTLRWCCPPWLATELSMSVLKQNIDIAHMDNELDYGIFKIKPFRLKHNVPNCGYFITFGSKHGKRTVFYATDCNNLDGVDAKNCDLYLIEGNYTEKDIIERMRNKHETGDFAYERHVLKNHLSVEKAEQFIANNAGPKSQYILLHEHTEKRRNDNG